jgi:DNA-directed RNA polymerase specialized sigma24 family protein
VDDVGQSGEWQWIAAFRDRLHRRMVRLVGHQDADDATQEAMTRAASATRQPRSGARLAWLTRIAMNWRIDEVRSSRRLQPLETAHHLAVELPAIGVDLRPAFRRLPASDRDLLLRLARGERYADIARRFHIAPAALRQRAARARLRLAMEINDAPRSRKEGGPDEPSR